MTWDAFHHRGEVLRAVITESDSRRDGLLPTDVPGVAETFRDDLALLGALQLRWHTLLSGMIERELMEQPTDLESAVLTAWRKSADELPGLRAILDRASTAPSDENTGEMMRRANDKEWAMLAAMAGLASASDAEAPGIGQQLEDAARATHVPAVPTPVEEHESSMLGRLKAALVA